MKLRGRDIGAGKSTKIIQGSLLANSFVLDAKFVERLVHVLKNELGEIVETLSLMEKNSLLL
jgi:hypothetical protein